MTYWISQPESQIFAAGALLMLAGAFILICLAFPKTLEPAQIPEWHTEPLPRAAVTHSEFKYTVMDDWYPIAPVAEFVDAVDEAADAITEVIQAVDPLDATHEIERIDPSVPLFYTIRRPPPYRLESFTQSWTTGQLARVLEAGRPQ